MKTYDIIFPRTLDNLSDSILCHSGITSLVDAKNKRIVSGELVVFAGTVNVAPNKSWLWGWEKQDAKSFAHRAIVAALDSIGGER